MPLQRTERPPEGEDWLHELKHDGYRAIAFRSVLMGARPPRPPGGRREENLEGRPAEMHGQLVN